MKGLFRLTIALPLFVCSIFSLSCISEKIETDTIIERDTNGNYVFYASLNDVEATKTIRQDNGDVFWDTNERIKIFYDSQTNGVFTSTNKVASANVSFSGCFNNPVSDTEIARNGVVALYASTLAEYDGNQITFTLPSSQEAEEGTFKKGLFPSVAQSKSSSLSFYNVCGGLKISVQNEGIKSITLQGNNSECLAGRISVSFGTSGVPEYSIVDGETEITLTAPGGGYFEVGQFYYIVALPCTLSNGFTLEYHTDDGVAKTEVYDTITISRSKFGLVLNKDVISGVVTFADRAFKVSVIEQYDDNFDGEIDFIEAENVTNINCANRTITSLEGIEYFVNLKSLNCSNNEIKEINLKSMSKLTTLNCYGNPIETLILDDCTALTSLSIINATTNSMSSRSVMIDGYEGATQFMFSSKGAGFISFSFINSNTVKNLEVAGDFTKSLNVYNVPGIVELHVGDVNVEVMDLHNLNLTTIDLTNNINLKELYLHNNQLSSINLSKNTQLTKLNLSDNELQSINVRLNNLLTELKVNNNSSISTLNIDNNLYLQTLEAEGLSISTLDMSQHSSLTDVKLRNNSQLKSIVIWEAATKRNDYLLFDMANVMVTDANGTKYGFPYTKGQFIPWFNGGVVYDVNVAGNAGMLVCLTTFYQSQEWGYEWFYYFRYTDDPDIPEMFYANSEDDGKQNLKDVYDYYGGYDKFVLYERCASYSRDGEWYLPAKEELKHLFKSILIEGGVNKPLKDYKGDMIAFHDILWTSSITDYGRVWYGWEHPESGTLFDTYYRKKSSFNLPKESRAIRKF